MSQRLFLVCYQNPQTAEWYWLAFARTGTSAAALIKATWPHGNIEAGVWEGFADLSSDTFGGAQ